MADEPVHNNPQIGSAAGFGLRWQAQRDTALGCGSVPV